MALPSIDLPAPRQAYPSTTQERAAVRQRAIEHAAARLRAYDQAAQLRTMDASNTPFDTPAPVAPSSVPAPAPSRAPAPAPAALPPPKLDSDSGAPTRTPPAAPRTPAPQSESEPEPAEPRRLRRKTSDPVVAPTPAVPTPVPGERDAIVISGAGVIVTGGTQGLTISANHRAICAYNAEQHVLTISADRESTSSEQTCFVEMACPGWTTDDDDSDDSDSDSDDDESAAPAVERRVFRSFILHENSTLAFEFKRNYGWRLDEFLSAQRISFYVGTSSAVKGMPALKHENGAFPRSIDVSLAGTGATFYGRPGTHVNRLGLQVYAPGCNINRLAVLDEIDAMLYNTTNCRMSFRVFPDTKKTFRHAAGTAPPRPTLDTITTLPHSDQRQAEREASNPNDIGPVICARRFALWKDQVNRRISLLESAAANYLQQVAQTITLPPIPLLTDTYAISVSELTARHAAAQRAYEDAIAAPLSARKVQRGDSSSSSSSAARATHLSAFPDESLFEQLAGAGTDDVLLELLRGSMTVAARAVRKAYDQGHGQLASAAIDEMREAVRDLERYCDDEEPAEAPRKRMHAAISQPAPEPLLTCPACCEDTSKTTFTSCGHPRYCDDCYARALSTGDDDTVSRCAVCRSRDDMDLSAMI